MSQTRKIRRTLARKEGSSEQFEVPSNHLKLPVGNVLSDPIKGDFLTIPLFGWVGRRVRTQTPLVMLTTLLINSQEDAAPRGTLQLEWPVFEDTESAIVAALERYGWDGRVWPNDAGWPDTDTVESEAIRELIASARLNNTLTFPPKELGICTQPVTIGRARGPFLMPPLPPPTEAVDPSKLQRLRELCIKWP